LEAAPLRVAAGAGLAAGRLAEVVGGCACHALKVSTAAKVPG